MISTPLAHWLNFSLGPINWMTTLLSNKTLNIYKLCSNKCRKQRKRQEYPLSSFSSPPTFLGTLCYNKRDSNCIWLIHCMSILNLMALPFTICSYMKMVWFFGYLEAQGYISVLEARLDHVLFVAVLITLCVSKLLSFFACLCIDCLWELWK